MTNQIAFLFPGQGSQSVGMGQTFYESYEEIKKMYEKADQILGYKLSDLMLNGPEDRLTKTENTQPALFLLSAAIFNLIEKEGIIPNAVAGHSLGEYSALYASKSLSFDDAIHLVHMRGKLMEEAVPSGQGTMAAVLGADETLIEEVTKKVTDAGDVVNVANFNSPGQIVISGTKEGVLKATELLKNNGAKRVIPLNVSGPFHSELMRPASTTFSQELNQVTINDAKIPVYANVTAKPVQNREDIQNLLIEQLFSPVQFTQSIEQMITDGIDTFVEVGNGKVLSGLVKKINRKVTIYSVNDVESYQQFIKAIKEE